MQKNQGTVKYDKTTSPKQNENQEPKRQFRGEQRVHHDLFKLEVEQMVKDVSWHDKPMYEKIEHSHFFHTIDKKGRKNNLSAPTGNHFHEIEYGVDEDGNFKATCGPALQKVRVHKGYGANRKPIYEIQNQAIPHDQHIHKVRYVRSEVLEVKKMDAEEIAKLTALDTASSAV